MTIHIFFLASKFSSKFIGSIQHNWKQPHPQSPPRTSPSSSSHSSPKSPSYQDHYLLNKLKSSKVANSKDKNLVNGDDCGA